MNDELEKYWRRHPEAYIAFRKEQMEQCKFKNGKVKMKHLAAYAYYLAEVLRFEAMCK